MPLENRLRIALTFEDEIKCRADLESLFFSRESREPFGYSDSKKGILMHAFDLLIESALQSLGYPHHFLAGKIYGLLCVLSHATDIRLYDISFSSLHTDDWISRLDEMKDVISSL